MTGADEHELVARAQVGDTEAFGTLYDQEFDNVYGFIRSRVGNLEAAEDLTQDTFVKAFESFSRFRLGASFGAWVKGIAKHVVADHLRRTYRWKEELPGLVTLFLDSDSPLTPSDAVNVISIEQMLKQILEELRPNYRLIIEMRFIRAMSTRDVALELFGSSNEENRRKVSVTLYKAMQAAKRVADRMQELSQFQM